MAITATINELFASRDGTSRGTGGNNYRRTFRVRLSGKTTADQTELNEPDPAGFLEALHPFGHAHPWNNFMAASGYSMDRRFAPDVYDCSILYMAVSESNPGTTGWIRTSGGNSIPQRTYTTLPDPERVTVVPLLADGGLSKKHIKGIGNRMFFSTTSSSGPIEQGYSVHTIDVDADGVPKNVYQGLVPTDVVVSEPEDVDVPGIAVTFTKIILDRGVEIEPIVRGYIKRVNSETFLGGRIATVYLDSFTLDPIPSAEFAAGEQGGIQGREAVRPTPFRPRLIPDITLQGVPAWRAALTFIASDVPFDPVERTPLWRDPETGSESVVLYNGEPFVEKFLVIRRVDFVEMFREIS